MRRTVRARALVAIAALSVVAVQDPHPAVARDAGPAVSAVADAWAAVPPGPSAMTDPGDGILGNPSGDVDVVAFVDRTSLPSEASMPLLIVLVATDPGVRVVVKELPLLSRASVEAARTAAAARMQGGTKARAFEAAMLSEPPDADGGFAARAAARAGLDASGLARDRMAPAVASYLRAVRAKAAMLGIDGTPTFLVGPHALVGLQAIGTLRAAVADARRKAP